MSDSVEALCNLSSLTSTLPLQQGMELPMRRVVIAATTPHFQAESVSLQHRTMVKAASVIGCYKKIPLKYYKKGATTPECKYVVFEPLHLHEPLCKLKMRGVNLKTCGWLLPHFPSHPSWIDLMQTANYTGEYEKASIAPFSFINRTPTRPNTIISARYYAKKKSDNL